ncbi:hypothetical protein, partial [Serratia marcescens]|uniref:hypothetical protein n=1 Tax=Serratia marcescens TaxID=615 RepID=UPI0013C2F09F
FEKTLISLLAKANVKADYTFAQPRGVETIGEPIRLSKVDGLEAKLTFTPLGLFTAKLTWNQLPDKRVQY